MKNFLIIFSLFVFLFVAGCSESSYAPAEFKRNYKITQYLPNAKTNVWFSDIEPMNYSGSVIFRDVDKNNRDVTVIGTIVVEDVSQ